MTILLCGLAVALNIADALLTDAVLARGGVEKNPVMRAIMRRPATRPLRWAIKLVICVGMLWLIVAGLDGWPRLALLGAFCGPFGWVAWHNWRALERLRSRAG